MSKVVVSAQRFYRKIAIIFIGYILVLALMFPKITPGYDWGFTVSLLLIISISTFAQYYFGITYQVFLNADQKIYVHSTVQIVTTILNTVISVILMKLGFGLHMVKLASAVVFVARPLVQNLYVKKRYALNMGIAYSEEPIQQKWNGFAQHLASVVTGEIDVVLLTLLSSYQNVSIYSIYLLVTNGITKLIMTGVNGLESFWGNMIAKKEHDLLVKTFEGVEMLIHTGITFLFVSTSILIAPFVKVYVTGLRDAEVYYVPIFGMLMALAYGSQCLRVPYFRIIKAAGHYRETQNGAFVSMIINIALSLLLVVKFQLLGVAVGTLVAMLYHTIYFAWYLRNHIINRHFRHFVKHMIVDAIAGFLGFWASSLVSVRVNSYGTWLAYAVIIAAIVGGITLILNIVLYRKEFDYIVRTLSKRR